MSESQFAISLVLLGLFYGLKNRIIMFINMYLSKNGINFKINAEYYMYLLGLIFAVVLVLGMVTGSTVKTNYGNVEDGFKNISPNKRPNPLFDIDTYW